MRYGILGDIHSNLEALEAVVRECEQEGLDKFIQVGDVVGYGAQPNDCCALLRDLDPLVVTGNHDMAALDRLDIEYFNNYARSAIEWTRRSMSDETVNYLDALRYVEILEDVTVVHGSLNRPEEFGYIQTTIDARRSLAEQQTKISFVGHSHVPVIFTEPTDDLGSIRYTFESEVDVSGAEKALINVGSVGQPRDEDPRAAYCIYDTEAQRVWIKRIAYDVDKAGRKIIKAGLPRMLAERLRLGV